MADPKKQTASVSTWRRWDNRIAGLLALIVLVVGYLAAPAERLDRLGHVIAVLGSTTGGQMIYGALVVLIVAALRGALAYIPVPRVDAPKPPSSRDGSSAVSTLGWVVAAGVALLAGCALLSGCGSTALQTQASGVTVALRVTRAAQDVVIADADARMGACADEACVHAARESIAPVQVALDALLVAVEAWGASIAVAADVDAGAAVPDAAMVALRRVLAMWDDVERLIVAAGVTVPSMVGQALAFLAALVGPA